MAEVRPGRRAPDAHRSHQVMLKVADAEATCERALARGATMADPRHDWKYGERQVSLTNPFGNQWVLNQTLADVPLEQ